MNILKKYKLAVFAALVSATVGLMTLLPIFAAGSASLNLSPTSGSYENASTFTVTITENSGAESVNVVEVYLSYETSKLQFVSIDTSSSAFANQIDNSGGSGSVHITRYTSGGSSVTGTQTVAKVKFKAITGSGTSTVSFGSGSHIVRSTDSVDIWNGSTTGGTYTLTTPATPPPAPSPTPAPVASPPTTATSSPTSTQPSSSNTETAEQPATIADDQPVPVETKADEVESKKYHVAIQVKDKKGNILRNTEVTLDDKETVLSDENGIASFSNVQPGEHSIKVLGESININVENSSDPDAVQIFSVEVEEDSTTVKTLITIAVVLLLVFLIGGGGFWSWKRYSNRTESAGIATEDNSSTQASMQELNTYQNDSFQTQSNETAVDNLPTYQSSSSMKVISPSTQTETPNPNVKEQTQQSSNSTPKV